VWRGALGEVLLIVVRRELPTYPWVGARDRHWISQVFEFLIPAFLCMCVCVKKKCAFQGTSIQHSFNTASQIKGNWEASVGNAGVREFIARVFDKEQAKHNRKREGNVGGTLVQSAGIRNSPANYTRPPPD